MNVTTAPPLLFALGLRIFLKYIDPSHVDSAPDYILHGLWQGVLLYHVLKHISWLVLPVGFAIAAKLLWDFAETFDTTRCACTLLGAALGVLCTDLLTQLFEQGRYNEVEPPPSPTSEVSTRRGARELPKRQRRASFQGDERPSHRHKSSMDRARPPASSPGRTTANTIDTAFTLDSLPSSLDPDGKLTPLEREVALLRANASLADSERRRCKEERKWALSQGNFARAEQLAWQVKKYAALTDSWHREADAKVVEGVLDFAEQAILTLTVASIAARAATQPPLPVPPPLATRHSQITYSTPVPAPALAQQAQPQSGHSNGAPLVSVTLAGGNSRSRKKSGGASILKPAIHVHTR